MTFRSTSTCELAFGGLRFIVHPPLGIELIEDDVCYRPFLHVPPADEEASELTYHVALELGGAPDVDALPLLFDTEESWSAHRGAEEVLLRWRRPDGDEPYLWVARLPLDGRRRIRVHCGSGLLDPESPRRLGLPLHYPLDQILALWLLTPRRGMVVHAAGLAQGDRGIFLAGVSGAGKTTFLRLAAHRTDWVGLSDDRVIVRGESDLRLYGTPWAGEGRIASPRGARLTAALFLCQAERNELRPIPAREALGRLMPVVSVPWFDRDLLEPALAFCAELLEHVPCYELCFRREVEAAALLDELPVS